MGGSSSKNQLYQQCLELFSVEEQSKIAEVFKKISDDNTDGFSESDLMKYGAAFMTDHLLSKLFFFMKSLITYEPGDGQNDLLVNDEEFLVCLAYILKGSTEEKTTLLMYLCTSNKNGPVKVSQLQQCLEDLIHSYEITLLRGASLNSWTLPKLQHVGRLTRCILHDLVYRGGEQQCDLKEPFPSEIYYSTDSICSFLSRSGILLSILSDVFHSFFPISVGDSYSHRTTLIPTCHGAPWSKLSTLLEFPSLVFLNYCLPAELRDQWRFLFSTRLHGESFSSMTHRIMHRGPTVVLVEDEEGHVFGGFTATGWTHTSQFEGDSHCFLFSLNPIMDMYPSTGYNKNYMYLNHGQETIPNGMGMGGQFGYFGLWLDYEFGKGESRAKPKCTTFNSPQLSANPQFTIKTVEVWGVGPEPKSAQAEEAPGSVLDKDPAAKAMLELLDKGPLSEGLREEDPMADMPEEHVLTQ